MNARTAWCLVFLALIKNSCNQHNPFNLEQKELTANEGACVEIICKVTVTIYAGNAYWFWMKDPIWTGSNFTGTVIYSTNQKVRPVSPGFADRVKFTGSTTPTWASRDSNPTCSVSICNLKTTDSGQYIFRYVGDSKSSIWKAIPEMTLNVTANPCPITFQQPPVVKENDKITLTCSTVNTCPLKASNVISVKPPSGQLADKKNSESARNTTLSFTAKWWNDGNVFTCQTRGNTDDYLTRNISIVVQYAPKDTSATISRREIKEGDFVTLTCSAKGQPSLNFSWFRNGEKQSSEAKWMIPSIQASQSGLYYCKAENSLGVGSSRGVTINVTYPPEVEVQISKEPATPAAINRGDKVTLTCHVNRSNPYPSRFTWYKDDRWVRGGHTYVVRSIKPEDSGSYTCTASNTAGSRTSTARLLQVQYRPMNTKTTPSGEQTVRVNSGVTLTCDTDAYPPPWYSWYKLTGSSQWTYMSGERSLTFQSVQRADEACYRCNATNTIDTGDFSEPVCIKVLFPPTGVTLSMDSEVKENETVTISCTAESFPLSCFTVTRQGSSQSLPSDGKFCPRVNDPNIFRHTFTASSTDAGSYSCEASNTEGRKPSQQRKLVVKYTPKDVKVEPQPGRVVRENSPFKLDCRARSHPEVTSVTWMKVTDGRTETLSQKTFVVMSAGPSDSGFYSCMAKNEIGAGKSEQVEVEVEYAPKHTTILKGEEQQHPNGTRSVTLSCSAQSHPPVDRYSWYKNTYESKGYLPLPSSPTLTVFSHQKGEYYCTAENKIGKKSSESIRLFDDTLKKAVTYFLLICVILFISVFIFFLYRHRRNKSIQRGTIQPSCGFLGWRNSVERRNLMNEAALAEPFRSRDDLLPEQPCRPNAQRCQPRPDSTPPSNVNIVYATVNLPSGKQAPSAPKPRQQHEEDTQNDSLNYVSLHFGNKDKKPDETVVVYAQVSKNKASAEMERRADYENITAVNAANLPNLSDSDSDTSDDETEVNYSQVNFKPAPGHRRDSSSSDSSTSSEEDETQYSQVKV